MGNRIAMDYNASGSGTGKNNSDEQYAYDGLNRLVDFKRGVGTTDLDGDSRADVVTTVKFRQQWTLDALGNWRTYQQTNSDTGFLSGTIYPSFTQNRTNNAVNEITGMTGPSWASTGYDSAGNMTAGPKTGAEASTITFRYDAWNRQAIYDANADGDAFDSGDYRYSYDGYGRRITKFQDTNNDATNNAGSTEEFYYNEDYQTVEVRVGSVVSGSKTIDGDAKERYLWDLNYIDAPAMVELDTNTDGTRDYRLWPTFDANYNVTSLVTDQGKVVERYAYTPYGQRLVINGGRNYADSAADPDGVDFSIDTNGSDFGFVGSGFQGLRHDAETGDWYQRARYSSPVLQFMQRDPEIFIDSTNLYGFLRQDPFGRNDAFGKQSTTTQPGKNCCCCCVERLDIKSVRYTNRLDARYGHEIDINVFTSYAKIPDATEKGDCTLEWWERTNIPAWGNNKQNVNVWQDGMKGFSESPVFKGWKGRKKPTEGQEQTLLADLPSLTAQRNQPNRSRTLEIWVIVRSGEGCNCKNRQATVWFLQNITLNGNNATTLTLRRTGPFYA